MEPRARPQRGIVWQGPGKAGARYRRARGGEGNKRLRERTKQMHRSPHAESGTERRSPMSASVPKRFLLSAERGPYLLKSKTEQN